MSGLYDEQAVEWVPDENNESILHAKLPEPHYAMVALAYMPKSKARWMWKASNGLAEDGHILQGCAVERDYGINEYNCMAAAIRWLNQVTANSKVREIDSYFPRDEATGEPIDLPEGQSGLGHLHATIVGANKRRVVTYSTPSGSMPAIDKIITEFGVTLTSPTIIEARFSEFEMGNEPPSEEPPYMEIEVNDPHEEMGFLPPERLKEVKLPISRDAKSMMADLHPEEAELTKPKKPRMTKKKTAELPKTKKNRA